MIPRPGIKLLHIWSHSVTYGNTMSDLTPPELPKRRGNPAMVKGGPSLNPKGRPRAGLALAERIRERLDPDLLLDLADNILNDETISDERKLTAILPLYDRGYLKPPTTIAAQVQTVSSSRDWSLVPVEEKRELLAQLRSLGNRAQNPKVLDGDAVSLVAAVATPSPESDEE